MKTALMSTPRTSAELVRELALKAGRRRVFAVLACGRALSPLTLCIHSAVNHGQCLASDGGHATGFDSPVGPARFELDGPFLEPSERLYNPHASVSISGSHVPCVHVVADLVCAV